MPETLQFGSFMVRMDWLLLAVSGILGYITMKWKVKRSVYSDQPVLDKFSNGLMIIFLVWKFSPVLFTPSILWKYPFGLLTMTGSVTGLWLGIAAALFSIDRSLRQMQVPRLFFADLLSLGIVTMVLVYNLLGWQYGTATTLPWGISINNPDYKYHPVNVYLLFVTVPMLIWLWRRSSSSLGSGKMMLNVLTYYSMGLMIVSFFKQKTNLLLGLSGEQLLYLLLMFLGFLLSIFLNRQIQQEITSVAERIEMHNDTARILPSDSGNAAIDPIGSEDSCEEKRPTFSD